ncbi:MAG: choice-of-anchor D domain-containing protein [Burkholderiaceae bacterium]|nr:choice-of-anchor D domain-containing protein [Burkholderiaceae bacterium]
MASIEQPAGNGMTRGFKRGAATGLLIAMAVGGFVAPAAAQDASNGYRLWMFTSTIKSTAQSCNSCHGDNPRNPPNAMLVGVNIGTACGQAWPAGTAHAQKNLCLVDPTRTIATQAQAFAFTDNAVSNQALMVQFRGLTTAERQDLAAFVLATHLGNAVPFARPEYQQEGSTGVITTLNFGSVSDGATASRVLYFTNGGNHPMAIASGFSLGTAISGLNQARYTVSPLVPAGETACAPSLPLAAGARCGLTVTFSPDTTIAAGALQTATLTIPSNGGSGVSQLNLNGSRVAVAAPTLTLNPAGGSYSIGPTPAGSTINFAPVTVTNSGTLALNFTSITIGGTNASDFTRATGGTSCTVGTPVGNGGGTCTLQFIFSPPAGTSGSRTATVEIASNAPGSPLTLNLTGTVGTVTPTIGFGTSSNTNQAFLRLQASATGVAANGVVTIRNPGAAGAPPLTITGVQLSSGSPTFSIAAGATNCLSAPVPAGGNCTINVTYTAPDMAVPHNGNIIVTSDGRTTGGTAGPHNVVLEGTVVVAGSGSTSAQAPNAPQVMQFQNTPVNTLSGQVQRVLVNNTGAAALTVQVRLGTGTQSDFTAVNGCTSIAAGNSCFVDVGFRPRNEGVRNDTLTLTYNGGSLPPIQLSGTGQAANLAGQGAGGGALPLSLLLALAIGTLLAARMRRLGLARPRTE